MEPHCLLGVYAHPADEAFTIAGTLRKYDDAGVKTALICATRGEEQREDDGLDLFSAHAAYRADELPAACEILGVDDLTVLDYPGGALSKTNALEVIGQLVYHIRRLQPHVIVTFDEPGLYGHPDHAAIHRLAVSAFFRSHDSLWYPEQLREGLKIHQTQKLYVSVLGQLGVEPPPLAPATTHAAALTLPLAERRRTMPLLRIALDDRQLSAKLAAIRVYQSQGLVQIPPEPPGEQMRALLGQECFRRLEPRSTASEDDLFAGL
ncbi:MAG TPA: PIG-L family deacetylase [Roseiflexaceae bacterium]|nr:PIG-L family deacetylase [Roseiflexaceae bacterium]